MTQLLSITNSKLNKGSFYDHRIKLLILLFILS